MKRLKFSKEQVACALRQAQGGVPVADVCRQTGTSEATFFNWKKKYAHLGVSELPRLRQVEDGNRRLKQLVANLTLDEHMLSEAPRQKSEANAASRARRVVPRGVPSERGAGVCVGRLQPGGVVQTEHGTGPDAAAHTDS